MPPGDFGGVTISSFKRDANGIVVLKSFQSGVAGREKYAVNGLVAEAVPRFSPKPIS